MMPGPLQLLETAEAAAEADTVSVALAVLEALTASGSEAMAVSQAIDAGFRSSPPLLAVGRAAAAGPDAVSLLRQAALDDDWIEGLAERLGRFPSVGILSMGAGTTAVLSRADALGRLPAQGFVASRAVARGLAFLDLTLRLHPPEEATVMLVPTVGGVGATVFIPGGHAERLIAAKEHGATVIPVVHPLARMDVELAGRFEPPPGIVPVEV